MEEDKVVDFVGGNVLYGRDPEVFVRAHEEQLGEEREQIGDYTGVLVGEQVLVDVGQNGDYGQLGDGRVDEEPDHLGLTGLRKFQLILGLGTY